MIPLHESHLRRILREWVQHYDCGRPQSSLGPGIPDETQKGDVRPSTKARSIEFDPEIRVCCANIQSRIENLKEFPQISSSKIGLA